MIMSKKQTWQEHRGKTDTTEKDHCKSATNNICPQAEDWLQETTTNPLPRIQVLFTVNVLTDSQ